MVKRPLAQKPCHAAAALRRQRGAASLKRAGNVSGFFSQTGKTGVNAFHQCFARLLADAERWAAGIERKAAASGHSPLAVFDLIDYVTAFRRADENDMAG